MLVLCVVGKEAPNMSMLYIAQVSSNTSLKHKLLRIIFDLKDVGLVPVLLRCPVRSKYAARG